MSYIQACAKPPHCAAAGALEPPAIASQIATPKFQVAAPTAAATAAQQPPAAAPAGFRKPPGLSLQVAAAPAPAPAAAAAAGGGPGGGPGFKKPALGGLGLQLQVGSNLPQGEWATNGVWKATDANEGLIPPHLQQIHADDLVKVSIRLAGAPCCMACMQHSVGRPGEQRSDGVHHVLLRVLQCYLCRGTMVCKWQVASDRDMHMLLVPSSSVTRMWMMPNPPAPAAGQGAGARLLRQRVAPEVARSGRGCEGDAAVRQRHKPSRGAWQDAPPYQLAHAAMLQPAADRPGCWHYASMQQSIMGACETSLLARFRAQVPKADQIGSHLPGCLCRHVGLPLGYWPHAQLHCPALPCHRCTARRRSWPACVTPAWWPFTASWCSQAATPRCWSTCATVRCAAGWAGSRSRWVAMTSCAA